ncbi:MAG: hypothetical protein MJ066_06030 [Clostridia bacterium]|nr:hypothetical protein [Clostridia bacterium]
MNCCTHNTTLWILIALLVLGSKDGFINAKIFTGCGLPVMLALLYCMYKNGTLCKIFNPCDRD